MEQSAGPTSGQTVGRSVTRANSSANSSTNRLSEHFTRYNNWPNLLAKPAVRTAINIHEAMVKARDARRTLSLIGRLRGANYHSWLNRLLICLQGRIKSYRN